MDEALYGMTCVEEREGMAGYDKGKGEKKHDRVCHG